MSVTAGKTHISHAACHPASNEALEDQLPRAAPEHHPVGQPARAGEQQQHGIPSPTRLGGTVQRNLGTLANEMDSAHAMDGASEEVSLVAAAV